jgi:hypothetical protein
MTRRFSRVVLNILAAIVLMSVADAREPVSFVNDTKASAVIHVVRTDGASSCAPLPAKHLGSTSNVLKPGESWKESRGSGCWSWSPGSTNFDDKKLTTWCVMADGGTYRLSADGSRRCRVDD